MKFILFLLLFLSYNLVFSQEINLKNYPDYYKESNDTNVLNFDNRIFVTGKTFQYKYHSDYILIFLLRIH